MAVTSESEIRPDYMYVTCTGSFDKESWLKVYRDALSAAAKSSLQGVLIDARALTGRAPSLVERYEIGRAIAEMQFRFSPMICLAVVGSESVIFEGAKFGETVAVNRGGTGKLFNDIEEAVVWLED